MRFDLIVVGGGLAGSTLGAALAAHGLRVLILERELTFKDRVRGEGMHPLCRMGIRRVYNST